MQIFVFFGVTLLLFSTLVVSNVHGETFQGWQVEDTGGYYAADSGVLHLWSNIINQGPTFYKEFSPKSDFEFSLQIKASWLTNLPGEDDGFEIVLKPCLPSVGQDQGVNFELRNRGNGMFLLARHTNIWYYDSFVGSPGNPFLYPSIYPNITKVDTNVWYTMKLSVQEKPFQVTAKVLDENGILLGSYSASDMTNFAFNDIKYMGFASCYGGDFYIKNISGLTPYSEFSYSPNQISVNEPVVFNASSSSQPNDLIANYTWDFGDGNISISNQPVSSHIYSKAGSYDTTLTVTDINGYSATSNQTLLVQVPTQLTIFIDSSSSFIGVPVNIYGKLFDYYGNSLSNEPVTLSYTFPGANSYFPVGSAITNETGNYDIQWVGQASGTFTLETEWSGNSTYFGASNTTTLSSLPYQNQSAFYVESNSTVTRLAFNSTTSELSFSVSGPNGTTGFTAITIAKDLVSNPINIRAYIDGKEINYSLTQTENAWLLTFNYHHSSHNIEIQIPKTMNSSSPIPIEKTQAPTGDNNFSNTILLIVVATTILGAFITIFTIRKRKQT